MAITNILQVGSPKPGYYNGLLMRANPTLHEEAVRLLLNFAPAGLKAIDLGAGQGAFSSRLRDHGYDVTSVDKNVQDFKAEGVTFVSLDFDQAAKVEEFQNRSRELYDVAIGMEVIEHVENPWEYCRFLLSAVKPGGVVLLTTPNIESAMSRIEFLFSGTFLHFNRNDYHDSGHINPLTFHELQLISNHLGAEILALKSVCALPWFVVSRRPSSMIKSLLASLVRPFLGQRAAGDITCLVLRKPRREAAAA